MLWKAIEGEELSTDERQHFTSILEAMARTSLCGHGTGLAEVANSALRKFPEEMAACLA
jgi:formate dehydrogenase iron-sulfur subunit